MSGKKRILICGSRLDVRGGIVSVIRNHLTHGGWAPGEVQFIPTHIEAGKPAQLLFFMAAYARVLLGALRGQYRVACLHTAERGSFYRKAILLRTLRRFGMRTVLYHHGAEFEAFYAGLPEGRKRFVRRTLEMADLNVVLSRRLTGMITDKAPGARVAVLYNAVETCGGQAYDPAARMILFLGRLGQRKGAYDLLEAIRRIDGALDAGVRFCLCGDGEAEAVRERAQALGVMHRIAHIGWVDGAQKEQYLRGAMLHVLPSYNEGLPMSILETMARGIPSVTTGIASIPEVIEDGVNGVMIEPGDVDALAQNLLRLAGDEALRLRMSAAARATIEERFAIGAHIRRLRELLEDPDGEKNPEGSE